MSINFIARYALILSMLPLSFGCATTRVDLTRIQSVEKIAIVGFQGLYKVKDPNERKKSDLTRALNVVAEGVRDISGEEDRQLRLALNYSYDELVRVLAEKSKLSVLPRKEMVRNKWYRGESKSRGDTPGFDLSTVDGVIGYPLVRGMTLEERETFMTQLGVDSIALVRLVWLTGSTEEGGWLGAIIGGKRIRPAAKLEWISWQRGKEEPVWVESGIQGCPTKGGIADLAGFALTPDMAPLLQEASDSGIRALAHRYNLAIASSDGNVGFTMDMLLGSWRCDYSK